MTALYRMGVAVLLLTSLLLVPHQAAAQLFAADIATGEQLAVRWCASCHLVKADQAKANVDAPSFLAIARMPDFSADRTAVFLMSPHPKMPSYSLSRFEAQAIASYIESLAKPDR
jgi:mono/diheme cytochrome c family protein